MWNKMFRNSIQRTFKITEIYCGFCITNKRLAGHSKWQNIRHIKAAKDAERAALFTKFSRMIKVAVHETGTADPNKSLKLSQVIEQCKRANMPTSTIQNVLKASQASKSQCKSYLLEVNGPGCSLILLDVFTDNLHHLKQNLSSILKKHRSKFADGLRHNFTEKGVIYVSPLAPDQPPDAILSSATEHAIEAGAEEVQLLPDGFLEFTCAPSALSAAVKWLEGTGYIIDSASVEYLPLKGMKLSDEDLESYDKMREKLEALGEVTRVWDNLVE